MERRSRYNNSEREKSFNFSLDTIIKVAVGAVIVLLIVIIYITSEQSKAERIEHQKFKKEISLLMEDIQRNEAAIVSVSNEIDTINKVINLNNKKEQHFNTIKNQLEKASKTVPKPKNWFNSVGGWDVVLREEKIRRKYWESGNNQLLRFFWKENRIEKMD